MPNVKAYEGAVVVPLFTDSGGVFRTGLIHEGRTLRESLYWRGSKQRYRGVSPNVNYSKVYNIEAVYAGHIVDQFGHFILDSLSRLWFAVQRPDLPIVWATSQRYKKWQEEILGLVGVKNQPLFLEEPTRFGKIHLPETGFTPECSFTSEFNTFVSRVSPSEVVPGRRCWLSRSLLPAGSGGILGEDKIEAEAQRLGWHVYHPQQHSVTDQLSFLSSCEDIAGWSGSAFHAVVLLTELKSRLHILARGTHMGTMFRAIADQKGFKQADYLLDLELISGSRAKATWRLRDETELIELLRAITLKANN